MAIGPVRVVEEVHGYRERLAGSRTMNRRLGTPLRHELDTVGLWLDFPAGLGASEPALHAAEHAIVNMLPLGLLCDRRDVGSGSALGDSPGGRVYLWDDHEGGTGLTEKAYLLLDQFLADARELLDACRCRDGCPSCVHVAGCARGNNDLHKGGGRALLAGHCVPTAARRRPEPARIEVEPIRVRVEASSPTADDRKRKVVENVMRERLAGAPVTSARVRDTLVHPEHGRVEVLDVGADRVWVRLPGSNSRVWLPLEQLRRPVR